MCGSTARKATMFAVTDPDGVRGLENVSPIASTTSSEMSANALSK